VDQYFIRLNWRFKGQQSGTYHVSCVHILKVERNFVIGRSFLILYLGTKL
jgi:hypothetical protein